MVIVTRSTMSAPLLEKQQHTSAFLADWTPARLLHAWIDEISALGVNPGNLVQTRKTRSQGAGFEWCSKGGAVQPEYGACSGQRQTIAYLQQAAGDPEATAAVLLSASLFMRVERTRARYPREAWPPFAVAQTLLAWTRMCFVYRWDAQCDATLPAHDSESGVAIASTQQLVRFLAVEHARVLHRFTPVYLTQAVAPSIVRMRAPETLPASLPAPAHSLRVPRDPARRRDPRWSELTREELETLIWQKPQRELAREFGVSEATIAKRCKVLEIKKPERGFWSKARAAAVGG